MVALVDDVPLLAQIVRVLGAADFERDDLVEVGTALDRREHLGERRLEEAVVPPGVVRVHAGDLDEAGGGCCPHRAPGERHVSWVARLDVGEPAVALAHIIANYRLDLRHQLRETLIADGRDTTRLGLGRHHFLGLWPSLHGESDHCFLPLYTFFSQILAS